LTALFAPPDRREALLALYAFNAEVARIRETVTEPVLGQMRIQWWRDTLSGFASAEAAPSAHPTAQALGEVIARYDLPLELFETLLDARERDMDDRPIPDQETLAAYVDATGGGLAVLAMHILGGGEAEREVARKVGGAFALCGLLRAIPFHMTHGRFYLPADMMADHKASEGAFQTGAITDTERAVIAELVVAVTDALADSRRQGGRLGRATVAAVLPATLAEGTTKRLRKAGYNPFAQVVQQSHRRPLTLAWRAWRGRY
jgi:phytoene synthase